MRHFYPSSPSVRSPSPSPSSLPSLGTPAATPQPAPVGSGQPVVDKVIADVEARREFGLKKYGTLLRTYNGRDALWDLYQELLDALMYLRQFHLERGPLAPSGERIAPVTEGQWSPVYAANTELVGHVTFIEGSLYWRPIAGRVVSADQAAVPLTDAPPSGSNVTPDSDTASYKHQTG